VRRGASYAAVAVLLGLAAFPLLTVAPAYAATHTIQLTADGPDPAVATVKAGDTIVFRNADPTFVHQVGPASTNWNFRCGPLAPGQECDAGTVNKPGDYLYQGVNLDNFKGKVVVPAPASPKSSPKPRPAASSPAARPSRAASPAASPSPTGGSGSVGPPLIGGGLPSGRPSGAPAPNVAPVPRVGTTNAPPSPTGPVVDVAQGRLPEPSTARKYGLPAALAAVAAAGVGSLLVRLLLAHPAARDRAGDQAGPVVTVD
jgi:plastocyanin